jgi:protocatechuate 3,4-dioxygenase beta subunit
MMTPGYEHTDWRRARVTGDGLFVVRGLRPDQLYWLHFRAPGRGTRTYALPKSLGSGGRLDVGDVVMRPGGGVEGRVVDEHGAPLRGLSVSISGTNLDELAWRPDRGDPTRVAQFDSRSVDTDARGRFRFTDLAAGAFRVSARVRGRPNAVTREVRTRDGEIVEDVELVIPLGGVIAGTIRYADGRALGDAAADLWLSSSRGGNAQIDPDGRFRFTGLDEGEHDISMLSAPEGFALTPRHGVTIGTEDLELVLAPAAKLAGTVVDADGRGVPARVYIRWAETPGRGAAIHTTDGEGRFAIDVPPGFRGSVHAMLPDSPTVQASVEDVTAGRSDLVLRIER